MIIMIIVNILVIVYMSLRLIPCKKKETTKKCARFRKLETILYVLLNIAFLGYYGSTTIYEIYTQPKNQTSDEQLLEPQMVM